MPGVDLSFDLSFLAAFAAADAPPRPHKPSPGTCSDCGCTELRACRGGCSWVNDERTVCSACLQRFLMSGGLELSDLLEMGSTPLLIAAARRCHELRDLATRSLAHRLQAQRQKVLAAAKPKPAPRPRRKAQTVAA